MKGGWETYSRGDGNGCSKEKFPPNVDICGGDGLGERRFGEKGWKEEKKIIKEEKKKEERVGEEKN